MEVVRPEIARLAERGGVDETILRRVVQDDAERGVRVPDVVLHLEKNHVSPAYRHAIQPDDATRRVLTPQWLRAKDFAREASFELYPATAVFWRAWSLAFFARTCGSD